MLHNKLLRGAFGGAVGGLLAWILSEPVFAIFFHRFSGLEEIFVFDAIWAAPIGLALGAVLGAAEGLSLRSPILALRGAAIGAVIGMLGGSFGVVIAEWVFQQVQGIPFIGRGIGWGIFGFFLGLAEGARRWSRIGARNAALGGAMGGFIGGVLFDVVSRFTIALGSIVSRGVALIVLGACIGILIAFVERVLAEAALWVIAGRQEGREIFLDKPRAVVGREETNDIYLSDPGVETRHAEIRAEGRGYVIVPTGGAVFVNRAPVSHHVLQADDEIQIGAARLRYRTRRSGARVSPQYAPPPSYSPPAQFAACPNCGASNRASARFCARCGQRIQ